MKYSILRTGLGSRWQVVSVFGSTIRQPIKRSPCLKGARRLSGVWCSARMGAQSLVVGGMETRPSVCGMLAQEPTSAHSLGIRARSIALRSVRMDAHSLVGVRTKPSGSGIPAQVKKSTQSQDIRSLSLASHSARMDTRSLVGVGTRPSGCGMRSRGSTNVHSLDIQVRSIESRSVRRMGVQSLVGVTT